VGLELGKEGRILGNVKKVRIWDSLDLRRMGGVRVADSGPILSPILEPILAGQN
jgi:hypothetical protein